MNDHLVKPLGRARVLCIDVEMLLDLFDGNREAVGEVLDAALVSVDEDLARVEVAVQTGDANTLLQASHRMKGTTGSIGCERLAEIASAIERASRVDAKGVGDPLVGELRRAVLALRIDVEAYAAGES